MSLNLKDYFISEIKKQIGTARKVFIVLIPNDECRFVTTFLMRCCDVGVARAQRQVVVEASAELCRRRCRVVTSARETTRHFDRATYCQNLSKYLSKWDLFFVFCKWPSLVGL